MSLEEVAEKAAHEARGRYNADWDFDNNERVDDWGYSEAERKAFVAGALYAVEERLA